MRRDYAEEKAITAAIATIRIIIAVPFLLFAGLFLAAALYGAAFTGVPHSPQNSTPASSAAPQFPQKEFSIS